MTEHGEDYHQGWQDAIATVREAIERLGDRRYSINIIKLLDEIELIKGASRMALDETDIRLGKLDPTNAPMERARRIVNHKISELERELASWKFVRDARAYTLEG
jgi:hypothetical protein